MVKGIVINDWDEDEGLQNKLIIPESLQVEVDDMMRVFYAHITGAAEAGNVVVRLSKTKTNVASYFTGFGVKRPYMINLLLDISEDPEIFGEMVLDTVNARTIELLEQMWGLSNNSFEYKNLEETLKEFLTTTIQELSELVNMTKEQRFARITSSNKSRYILEELRKRPLTRIDIQGIVESKTGQPLFNVDAILDPFIKTEILTQDWLTGDNNIYLFLVRDFEIVRVPNASLKRLVRTSKYSHLAELYDLKVKEFFESYEACSDCNELAVILLNPMKYSIIEQLRKQFMTIEDLKNQIKRNLKHFDMMLEELINQKVVYVYRDESGKDWAMLITDIKPIEIYPEYITDSLAQLYNEKRIQPELAIKHLNYLEKNYIS
jgi:hypothetical protein